MSQPLLTELDEAPERPELELIKDRRPPGLHAHVIARPDISHDEWLQVRSLGIGGSDVAAIAGVSPYASRYAMWLIKTGRVSSHVDALAAKLGNLLEPTVLELFQEETGLGVLTTPGTLQHPVHDWMLVNLDGIATEAPGKRKGIAVIECKTNLSSRPQDWGNEDPDEPLSAQYMLQVQHELEVSGLEKAYVPVLLTGPDFRIIEVERDEELIKTIIDLEEQFWELVVNDTPPPIDGMESTEKLLNKTWQSKALKVCEGTEELLPMIDLYNEWNAAEKRAIEKKNEIKNALKALMEDAEILKVGDDVVATWKTHEVKGRTQIIEPRTQRTFRFGTTKGTK